MEKIESKQLRVGNFIGCDGNILVVEKIDIQNNIGYSLFENSKGQHVNSGNKYYIELTEEWLLKFSIDFKIPRWIKYVHTLQNWYYYETKCVKELTVKS